MSAELKVKIARKVSTIISPSYSGKNNASINSIPKRIISPFK
jgi:hypothetical protein